MQLAGGSPGGARPKVVAGFNPDTEELIAGTAKLLHASHRLSSHGYDGFLKVTHALTRDHRQLLESYRRMTFNVLTHNRDDHVKNFAFLMSSYGEWNLAPAYDLVPSEGINGWHTMDVAGEAQDPQRSDMLRLAETVGLAKREAEGIIEQVSTAVAEWPRLAAGVDVNPETVRAIGKLIRQ